MNSLSDPPCLIEHELCVYVQTLFGFFIRCPHGNVYLMSVSVQGGRGVLCYFHTYVGLGHSIGLKILKILIFYFGFQKNDYFLGGYEEYFLGCLKFLIFFGRTVDAGPEPTHEEQIRVPPLWSPCGVMSTDMLN